MHHGQNGLMGSKIYHHRTGIDGRKTIRAWADSQRVMSDVYNIIGIRHIAYREDDVNTGVKELVDGWIGRIDTDEVSGLSKDPISKY